MRENLIHDETHLKEVAAPVELSRGIITFDEPSRIRNLLRAKKRLAADFDCELQWSSRHSAGLLSLGGCAKARRSELVLPGILLGGVRRCHARSTTFFGARWVMWAGHDH
jgi:hypothetical protein